jgi:prepilin-type N-terminal cleavage/methylation domain-containing protein
MTDNTRSKGFTLIELLLAMAFIAFLLLFMVAAILQVTKLYVKGVAIRQINQTGRQLMEEVGSTLRNNASPVYIATQDAGGTLCKQPYPAVDKAKSLDLVGADITPLEFSVKPQGRLWTVSLVLSTSGTNIATPDASSPTGFSCAPDNQFCALGDFETSVYSRGGE